MIADKIKAILDATEFDYVSVPVADLHELCQAAGEKAEPLLARHAANTVKNRPLANDGKPTMVKVSRAAHLQPLLDAIEGG